MNNFYNRKYLRLKYYDYSKEGLYFVTICENGNFKFFGDIQNNILILNEAGKMIEAQWLDLPQRFTNIKLHQYVVMPNHFHAIIEITQNSEFNLSDIIGAFKSLSTNEYMKGVQKYQWLPFDKKLWQRNYYEHIIRNEESYIKLSEYIISNPILWKEDKFYC